MRCTHTRVMPTRADIPSYQRRAGRALVECMVAMLMLAISALALSTAARAAASLADDALLMARAQSLAASAADRALVAPCDSTSTSSFLHAPRIEIALADRSTSSLRIRTVNARLQPSPFAQRDSQRLALSTGRVCP